MVALDQVGCEDKRGNIGRDTYINKLIQFSILVVHKTFPERTKERNSLKDTRDQLLRTRITKSNGRPPVGSFCGIHLNG